MDEKETTEEKKPEGTTGTEDEGSQPKAVTLIDQANSASERLEKANERKAELLRQEEELMAKRALGGNSEAGQSVEKKEETALEYKDKVMSGNL